MQRRTLGTKNKRAGGGRRDSIHNIKARGSEGEAGRTWTPLCEWCKVFSFNRLKKRLFFSFLKLILWSSTRFEVSRIALAGDRGYRLLISKKHKVRSGISVMLFAYVLYVFDTASFADVSD